MGLLDQIPRIDAKDSYQRMMSYLWALARSDSDDLALTDILEDVTRRAYPHQRSRRG